MDQNKYKILINMLEEIHDRLVFYKERTSNNYEWIKSEREVLEKDITNLINGLKDTEYYIYILNNFKKIIKNIFNVYLKKATIPAVTTIALLSLMLGAAENLSMFLVSVPAGLALTALGGSISLIPQIKNLMHIKRSKKLEEEEKRKLSLESILEIKQNSLKNWIETEKAFKERMECIDNERAVYGMYLSNVIMAEGFANEQANSNVVEINEQFKEDIKMNEIMKLARKKLGINEQK